ncbi:DUF1471 domain-containing protein [Erwinia sorbitola]|uniref:DUF1471 domain-containing protein n=1 Tax=Erwinia sorbitola TaxID=2681984 RepID=A0A6I6EKA4_9GAMM|nr:DUF1471 domain-containing protein [Erwinia sorbitola]MTD28609.1 DUF1471 domain-containing protein [Erwinia sorbitola]QGU86716.1 DUF1471 domain-containing protein [Erwinia sorbitola]
MNKILPAMITAIMLAATSFSTLAATEVDHGEASTMHSMGMVSVSGVRGTMDDLTRQLAEKASAQGASSYRVIGASTPGDSSHWLGNAEIYR